ncbi:hypothetical protein JHK87_035512 [Glycine soja]|nr:hypothetical protein JHK87_035512 [Glycine soja]
MDLETENRLAAMLMREVAELRRQPEREGCILRNTTTKVQSSPPSSLLSRGA